MKKNNRELAEAFDTIDTTWKKWSREFLPPDPSSGKGRGRTREYTPDDAFKVFFGGLMVSEKGMTFKESREALEKIIAFMDKKDFFPILPKYRQRKEEKNAERWDIEITRTPEGSNYSIFRVLSDDVVAPYYNPPIQNHHRMRKEYESFPISEQVNATPICTVHFILNDVILDFINESGF